MVGVVTDEGFQEHCRIPAGGIVEPRSQVISATATTCAGATGKQPLAGQWISNQDSSPRQLLQTDEDDTDVHDNNR